MGGLIKVETNKMIKVETNKIIKVETNKNMICNQQGLLLMFPDFTTALVEK